MKRPFLLLAALLQTLCSFAQNPNTTAPPLSGSSPLNAAKLNGTIPSGTVTVPVADLSGTIPNSNLATVLQNIVNDSGTVNLSGTTTTLPSLSQTLSATAFSGSGAALNSLNASNVSSGQLNATYTYNPTAQTYFANCVTAGVTLDNAEKLRISKFCDTLSAAGILTNLVDACFLRSTQNNGSASAPLFLLGNISGGFHASPTVTAAGVSLNGSSQYGDFTTPALTANTVAMTYAVPPMYQPGPTVKAVYGDLSATMLEFGSASGYLTACLESLTGNGTSGSPPNGWAQVITAQSSTTGTSANLSNSTAQNGVSIIDPILTHDLAISTDDASSPTLQVWIDGNQTFDSSTGMVQATSSCTRLILGNRCTGTSTFDSHWWNGTIAAFAVFNISLNSTQEDALMVALRWLQPEKRNIVFYGDSITGRAPGNINTTSPWWQQWMTSGDAKKLNARVYNMALGGSTANAAPTAWPAGIHCLRPRGPVEDTIVLSSMGSNDIRGDTEGELGTFQSYQVIWGYAQADHDRVIQTTILPANDYTSEQEAQRETVNFLVKEQWGTSFDGLFEWDKVIPNPNDAVLSGGIHPTDVGNSLIAAAFTKCLATTAGTVDDRAIGVPLGNFSLYPDGVATASSTTFTSASANFKSYDAGKSFTYYLGGFGTGDTAVTTTISSVTNATTVVLAAAPSSSVNPCTFSIAGRIPTNASLWESGRLLEATITANTELCNPSNPRDGQVLVYCLTEDGTGSHSVTLDSAFSSTVSGLTWDSSTSQTANSVRYLTVRYSAANSRWDILGIRPAPVLPLTQGGTGVTARSFVFAIQGASSNVSLTNSTFTNIPFNSTVHDNLGEFSGGIYTLKQAGLVKLKTRVWMDNGNGTVDIMIKKNAGTFYQEFHAMPGSGTNQCTYGADTYDIGAIGDAYSVYVDTPNTGSNAYGNASPLTFFYAETIPF